MIIFINFMQKSFSFFSFFEEIHVIKNLSVGLSNELRIELILSWRKLFLQTGKNIGSGDLT